MVPTQMEIERWTAAEFERQVFAGNPKVAVFDCDGTLWGGDAGHGFMTWSIEQGLVSRSTSDWIDTRYRGYMAGKVSELEICGAMVQMYAGLREQELREGAARYVREFVQPRFFAEMAALVAALREGWRPALGRELDQQMGRRRGCARIRHSRRAHPCRRSTCRGRHHYQRTSRRAHRRGQGRYACAGGNAAIPMRFLATPFMTWRCSRSRATLSR